MRRTAVHRRTPRAHASVALALVVTLVFSQTAVGMTRSDIVSRGKRWVVLQVPYSQSATFEGYRTDCSGMLSMSWALAKPGFSTRTLAPYGVKISRDELQPGDMLLKYNYHAAIFLKWANSDHTWYWTLEQSSSAGKAVMRLTKYPYWDVDGFSAYRPAGVTEVNDYTSLVTQVSGTSRYDTAIAASKLAFPDGSASRAVVCSGNNWPDALGASALAGAIGAPVLLTGRDQMPEALPNELNRLGVSEVVLVGGTSAVTTSVAGVIEDRGSVSVRRIGGQSRYDTAALVASETVAALASAGRTYDGGAYIATGLNFPDALGAATVAAHTGRPVLLSQTSELTTPTLDALRAIGTTRPFMVGGTGALTPDVHTQLTEFGTVERFAGTSRYETSYLLAQHGVDEGLSWNGLAYATGAGYADALAGAVAQARRGSVLQLCPTGHLEPSSDRALREHTDDVARVFVYGGTGAVSPLARRQMRWILLEP